MATTDQGYGRERDSRDRDPRERESREREPSRRPRGGTDPLDQRVDRWVTAGRQFVEGVAGSRPGGRPAPRSADRRPRFGPAWTSSAAGWRGDSTGCSMTGTTGANRGRSPSAPRLYRRLRSSSPPLRALRAARGWRPFRAAAGRDPPRPSRRLLNPVPARIPPAPMTATGPMTPASPCPGGNVRRAASVPPPEAVANPPAEGRPLPRSSRRPA